MSAAPGRPKQARTAGETEGTPASAARPPAGTRSVAAGQGTPVSTAGPPRGAQHRSAQREGTPVDALPISLPESSDTLDSVVLDFRQYICRACGLIYDEARGDPDSGLAPGTRFEDIPEDWECPLCGVTKKDFEPYVVKALEISSNRAVRVDAGRRHEAGVVIVGAGTAGWTMARAIREVHSAIPITLVTGCSGDLYDKPLLSVAMAKAIGVPALVKEAGAAAAQRLGIRLVPETVAISITPGANALRTTRGAMRYDHLVLAHVALPRMDERLSKSLCWAVNDLRCYARFRDALGKPRRAQQLVVIGAGLVGCEMANDLALAGHTVVLIDVAERPLASVITPAESAELLQAWSKLPITFIGRTSIKSVASEGQGVAVETDAGFSIKADHVLSATGLQTPSRLAESAGLQWNNGIAVDPMSLATNVPNVHALGDCISINGQPLRFIEPIAKQARVIASRLAGCAPLAYEHAKPVIRVKTSSKSFTV